MAFGLGVPGGSPRFRQTHGRGAARRFAGRGRVAPMAGVGPLALPAAPAPRGLPLYRPPPLAAWAVMPISAGGGPAGALCRTLAHRYFRTPAVGISGKMRSNAVLLTRKLTRQQ